MFSCYFMDFGRFFATFEISISKNVNELFDKKKITFFSRIFFKSFRSARTSSPENMSTIRAVKVS